VLKQTSFKKKKAKKKKAFGDASAESPVGRDGRGWSVFGSDSNEEAHDMGSNPMTGMRNTDLVMQPPKKHNSFRKDDEIAL
jgi:hypothetical protein